MSYSWTQTRLPRGADKTPVLPADEVLDPARGGGDGGRLSLSRLAHPRGLHYITPAFPHHHTPLASRETF